VVAVIGKRFARFETGKTTDDSVTLDGGDLSIFTAYDPLAPLHRHDPVTPVSDGDVVDEGMRLIG